MKTIRYIAKGLLVAASAALFVGVSLAPTTAEASTPQTSPTYKTVTLTSYSTEKWYRYASDTSFPSTKTVSYYDVATHQTLQFSIPKYGVPQAIASKYGWVYSTSDGRNMFYDPIDHTRLGYMSNNTDTYWGGLYRFSEPPRKPSDYYGPDADKSGWTLVAIHWADPAPQPASDYPNLTRTPLGYYWISDGTDGQPVEYNKYRKGVWLQYRKKTTTYEWQQEYQGTVHIPLTKTPPPPPPPSPPGGSVCTPPTIPPKPSNRVLSYTWSPDGSGGQILTWTDTHWVLQQGTDGTGCPTEEWADEPVTYRHNYPLNLSNLQITGLFYDPGQPGDVWSPTNQSASQQNADAYADGSTMGGAPAKATFGNPLRNPAVYARVGGGIAFRLKWIGSPHDMPSHASVTFQMVNPDGEENVWSQSFALLPRTIFNAGDTPVWDRVGNGYPPPATEYGWAYASIPKYATTGVPNSFSQLTAWNLTGDPASAAHMKATVTFTTGTGSSVTWTNAGLAQTLGYPTWYFLHQIPNTAANYAQSLPTWSLRYTAKSFPEILLPRDTVSGS